MLVSGIDKFMSECRALVNFCGNAVATLFIARWDKTLDIERARRVLRGDDVAPLHEIDEVTHAHRDVRSADQPTGSAPSTAGTLGDCEPEQRLGQARVPVAAGRHDTTSTGSRPSQSGF
jgi:aerobic C4-dicarboxylate transport protein